jgi:ubiquinone/menaquinone biosynthesis C-methylase UbiE
VQDHAANHVLGLKGIDLCKLSLLDLGCGQGYMLSRLARALPRGARLVGIDLNERAITRAKALVKITGGKTKTEFRCIDAENMAFDEEEFDAVVANLSFSVFKKPTEVAYRVARILKPEGRLIVTEVSSLSVLGKIGTLLDAATGHLYYNLLSPSSLANLFVPFGLDMSKVARVPLEVRVLKHDLKIPPRLSPVFLIELARPDSFAVKRKK